MSTTITHGDAPVTAASPPPKRRAARASSVLVYLSPVAMFVVLALTTPGVLSTTGVMSLLVLASVLGLAAVGQTWAVMIGGIDLSIPATIGMANVLVTTLYAEGWGFGRIVLLV
ncbi:MAG: inner-rane translocator, partial [Nocardioides sp.]|nr:inner-rane translocator [Nocardioides sp.]